MREREGVDRGWKGGWGEREGVEGTRGEGGGAREEWKGGRVEWREGWWEVYHTLTTSNSPEKAAMSLATKRPCGWTMSYLSKT